MVPCVEGDGGGGGGVGRAVPVVLRGRAAVRDDLVKVGQVLRGGVDALPNALVVAGSPGVGNVHGAAAVGVERDGPEAAADAEGGHRMIGVSAQNTFTFSYFLRLLKYS